MILAGDQKVSSDWTKVSYDVSEAAGKIATAISFHIVSDTVDDAYGLLLGNISIGDMTGFETSTVSDLKVDGSEFDEDTLLAGERLFWNVDVPADYYEVFRSNQDGSKSLLGVSNNTCFYVNTLPRTDETNQTRFEVIPVNRALEAGTGAEAVMEWPNTVFPKQTSLRAGHCLHPVCRFSLQAWLPGTLQRWNGPLEAESRQSARRHLPQSHMQKRAENSRI